MKKHKDWELFDSLPDGWQIDNTVGSPLHGYAFCNNKISIIRGGRRALVRICVGNYQEKFVSSDIQQKQVVVKNETTGSSETVN